MASWWCRNELEGAVLNDLFNLSVNSLALTIRFGAAQGFFDVLWIIRAIDAV